MQQQEIFRQVAASEREKDRVLPNEVLQRKGLAYRREKRTSWKPRGWKVKAKKDWQSVRKLRSENREQEKQAEVEKEQVQQVDTPQHEEPAYRRPKRPSVQPNGWKIKTKKDWQSVRKLRKEQEKETQQVANKQPSAVLHRLDLSETPFHPRTHHDRLRRDETHSHHYAENVRTIRDKRTLYDERNRQSREGKLLPERAFEPWQEKVLERSFHVEEEKAQPVYLRALLFSRESAVRTSDGLFVPEYAIEPPHHERLRRKQEQPRPESEFGNKERHKLFEEYEWWLKQQQVSLLSEEQQPAHHSRTSSTLHQFGKTWEPSADPRTHARTFRKRLSGLERGRSP